VEDLYIIKWQNKAP